MSVHFTPRVMEPGTPRPNAVVDSAAHALAWAASELGQASRALGGREKLIDADLAELKRRLDSATAMIARLEAEITAPDSGLRLRGATNEHPAVPKGLRS